MQYIIGPVLLVFVGLFMMIRYPYMPTEWYITILMMTVLNVLGITLILAINFATNRIVEAIGAAQAQPAEKRTDQKS